MSENSQVGDLLFDLHLLTSIGGRYPLFLFKKKAIFSKKNSECTAISISL